MATKKRRSKKSTIPSINFTNWAPRSEVIENAVPGFYAARVVDKRYRKQRADPACWDIVYFNGRDFDPDPWNVMEYAGPFHLTSKE